MQTWQDSIRPQRRQDAMLLQYTLLSSYSCVFVAFVVKRKEIDGATVN